MSNPEAKSATAKLSREQVAAFLQSDPDFFIEYEYLFRGFISTS